MKDESKLTLTNKLLAAAQPPEPQLMSELEHASQDGEEDQAGEANEAGQEGAAKAEVQESQESPSDLVATEDLEGGMLIDFVGHVAVVVHNPDGAPTKARIMSSAGYVDLRQFKQYKVLPAIPEGTHRPISAGSMSTVNLITRSID